MNSSILLFLVEGSSSSSSSSRFSVGLFLNSSVPDWNMVSFDKTNDDNLSSAGAFLDYKPEK